MAIRRASSLWPAAVAASLALLAALLQLRGVDLAASVYRVGLFRREGLTLWDSQWYGGHWTLGYSVLFPPVAALLGLKATGALSAAGAAVAFDRLAVARLGPAARAGTAIFAVGTLAQVAIGELPFLLGEALALGALWAASRRCWSSAAGLAVAAAAASPLAGAFLGLALVAWLIASWPAQRGRIALAAAGALAPVCLLAVAFPGQGAMPFPAGKFAWMLAVYGALTAAIPRHRRTLRAGVALYVLAVAASFLVPTALGGNISRLGACAGAPLAACLARLDRRRALGALVVPLALLQWSPALGAFTNGDDPSTHAAYFRPLTAFLHRHAVPAGRVEVIPTRLHWEAAFVAPHVPLARGWERQLDTADNPLFYGRRPLTAGMYRRLAHRQWRPLRRAARRPARLRRAPGGPPRAPRCSLAAAGVAHRALARVRGGGFEWDGERAGTARLAVRLARGPRGRPARADAGARALHAAVVGRGGPRLGAPRAGRLDLRPCGRRGVSAPQPGGPAGCVVSAASSPAALALSLPLPIAGAGASGRHRVRGRIARRSRGPCSAR